MSEIAKVETATAALAQSGNGGGRPQIAKALARAQQKIRAVPHDAENAFHKYKYTSAEAIIEAAKEALADCGLALLPLEETLDGWERQGENRFQLVCRFVLLHESGESIPLVRYWPVCPDKGRPLDKATAAASTLALAYLLRDLCLMPRVDPSDEGAGRQERPKSAQQPAGPTPAERAGRVRTTGELLRQVHRELSRKEKTWQAALEYYKVPVPDSWEEPPAGDDGLGAVAEMESWVPRAAVLKILDAFTPKDKSAPKAS